MQQLRGRHKANRSGEDWAHLEGLKRSSCLITFTPYQGTGHVQLGQPKTRTECDGGGANPRKKEESFTCSTEQRHVEKNSGELRNPNSWTALSTSLFGSLPLLWASHVVRRVHLDPGNSNEAPTGNMEKKEEEQIKGVENAVEPSRKDNDIGTWL